MRLLALANAVPSAEPIRLAHAYQAEDSDISIVLAQQWNEIDRKRRFLVLMQIGAMTEAVREAGRREQITVVENWNWRAKSGDTIVHINIIIGHGLDEETGIMNIGTINSCRRMFSRTKLNSHIIEHIHQVASGIHGTTLHWITESASIKAVARLSRIAESARFSNHYPHAKLQSGLRLDFGWQMHREDFGNPDDFQIYQPTSALHTMLRYWSPCKMGSRIGLGFGWGILMGWIPVMYSGALVMISGGSTGGKEAVQVGRSMWRIWVTATLSGLSVQPIPACCLLTIDWWQEASPAIRQRLCEGWNMIVPGHQPLMLIRLGLEKTPKSISSMVNIWGRPMV